MITIHAAPAPLLAPPPLGVRSVPMERSQPIARPLAQPAPRRTSPLAPWLEAFNSPHVPALAEERRPDLLASDRNMQPRRIPRIDGLGHDMSPAASARRARGEGVPQFPSVLTSPLVMRDAPGLPSRSVRGVGSQTSPRYAHPSPPRYTAPSPQRSSAPSAPSLAPHMARAPSPPGLRVPELMVEPASTAPSPHPSASWPPVSSPVLLPGSWRSPSPSPMSFSLGRAPAWHSSPASPAWRSPAMRSSNRRHSGSSLSPHQRCPPSASPSSHRRHSASSSLLSPRARYSPATPSARRHSGSALLSVPASTSAHRRRSSGSSSSLLRTSSWDAPPASSARLHSPALQRTPSWRSPTSSWRTSSMSTRSPRSPRSYPGEQHCSCGAFDPALSPRTVDAALYALTAAGPAEMQESEMPEVTAQEARRLERARFAAADAPLVWVRNRTPAEYKDLRRGVAVSGGRRRRAELGLETDDSSDDEDEEEPTRKSSKGKGKARA